MLILKLHSDAAHGWLKVPHPIVELLGIGKDITSYSYMDVNFAYLEEDCDAHLFDVSMREKGLDYETKQIYDGEHSPIRRKDRYKC
jgi:hypothetical protein